MWYSVHTTLRHGKWEKLEIITLIPWDVAREEDGIVLHVVKDEAVKQLHICQTGVVVRSEGGFLARTEPKLKPTGLDGIQLPSSNVGHKTTCFDAHTMPTNLKSGGQQTLKVVESLTVRAPMMMRSNSPLLSS